MDRTWRRFVIAVMAALLHLGSGHVGSGGHPGGPMTLCKDGTVRPFQDCPK